MPFVRHSRSAIHSVHLNRVCPLSTHRRPPCRAHNQVYYVEAEPQRCQRRLSEDCRVIKLESSLSPQPLARPHSFQAGLDSGQAVVLEMRRWEASTRVHNKDSCLCWFQREYSSLSIAAFQKLTHFPLFLPFPSLAGLWR